MGVRWPGEGKGYGEWRSGQMDNEMTNQAIIFQRQLLVKRIYSFCSELSLANFDQRMRQRCGRMRMIVFSI